MTPAEKLWLVAGGMAALAIWSLAKFVASARRERTIDDTPLVKIRSAAQGYVKVFGRGTQADDSGLTAPLSRKPCLWYSYEVAERRSNSRRESNWVVTDSGTSVHPFLLTDDTGSCLVGPVNAEITATSRNVWYPCSDVRNTERLLDVGSSLSVTGELRSHSEIDGAEAATTTLLRQWKQDQAALLARFDHNHDGRIDAAEWQEARDAAAKEAQGSMLKSPVVRTSVIAQPTHGEPFLIAAMNSSALMRREKIFAALYFCAGLLFISACGWAIRHAIEP
jgi:hypothetical protein